MKYLIYCILFLGIFFGICPTYAAWVSFEEEVRIKRPDQVSLEKFDQGKKLELNAGETVFILTKEGLPVILTSPLSKDSHLSVASPHLKYILAEQLRPSLETSTNIIIKELRRAEALIQKKDLTQAQSVILPLKEKYPDISSILFMSGTVNFLLNSKSAAIEDLSRGLQIDPDYEPAKKLLAQLKGVK